MGGEPVYLNIYDLSDQNSWTYWCGVGIFHSGLEVYGVEYAYGGRRPVNHDSIIERKRLKGLSSFCIFWIWPVVQVMSMTCQACLQPIPKMHQDQVGLLALSATTSDDICCLCLRVLLSL